MKIKILIVLFIFFALFVAATTWFPVKHKCPLCNGKSTYQEIGSYGSYIYQWPSKFQYIYWPMTDGASVYSCPDCHFSVYMWDFDSVPEQYTDTLKAMLKTTKLKKQYDDYMDIPMSTRLEIAEKVYAIYGRDDDFWCRFYRILAYHYDQEGEKKNATECRKKAQKLAFKMLADTCYAGQEKEKMLIIAAMYNFTDEKDSALIFLDKARALTFTNDKMKPENAEGLEKYLTGLITEYSEIIRKEKEE